MVKICIFGLCCLDIINEVIEFPIEDSDQRCLSQYWQRGGNASNTAAVLSFIGAEEVHFCGTIADSYEKSFLLNDLVENGVNTKHCQILKGYECPNSTIILSRKTGTRTIIHSNKDLPELSYEYLTSLPLKTFDWIHFEGRNVNNVEKMIKSLSSSSFKPRVSVEVEKCRGDLVSLIKFADVVFVSKEYAMYNGSHSMEEAVVKIGSLAKNGATIVCAWGEKGATVKCPSGNLVSSPAFPPAALVDTIGAGDSFIAAFIYAASLLMTEQEGDSKAHDDDVENLQRCVTFACKIAGNKVGIKGWESFKKEVAGLMERGEIRV